MEVLEDPAWLWFALCLWALALVPLALITGLVIGWWWGKRSEKERKLAIRHLERTKEGWCDC